MGYWREILRRTTARTNRALHLDSIEQIVLAIIIGVVFILALLFLGRSEDAESEFVLRGIGIAIILLVWPVLWVVNYFREQPKLYNENIKKIQELMGAEIPSININWRFKESYAEVIITNTSNKSITGIDLMLRNYRKDENSDVIDVMRSLVSNDGKHAPMVLNPIVPTYFRIAKLKKTNDGEPTISVLFDQEGAERWMGNEVWIKLGLSGNDIANHYIKLKLLVNNNEDISISPWHEGENAVGLGVG